MSYVEFIGSVTGHAGRRIATRGDALGGATARVLLERVEAVIELAYTDAERGLASLQSEDNRSWLALDSEFKTFTAQHDTGEVADDYDDPASPRWWPKLALKAKSVIDSILGVLGDVLSDRAKRAFLLLKELLDLLY